MKGNLNQLVKKFRFFGLAYRCVVCGNRTRKFFRFSKDLERAAKSAGFPFDFRRMETLNYFNCNCPFCLSSDRERLYLIYLEKILESKPFWTILDFAPNPWFAHNLKNRKNVSYTSADIQSDTVDLKLDITNMSSIASGTYDIVICSHILEHVKSPEKALLEIRRVLKDDGFAIVMVPLFWDAVQFIEDPGHTTPELRLKHYGQEDHVRLYSKQTFVKQLTDAGLFVNQVTRLQLDENLCNENAIDANSILYVGRKSDRIVKNGNLD